jgi:hypothetical protein
MCNRREDFPLNRSREEAAKQSKGDLERGERDERKIFEEGSMGDGFLRDEK